MLVKKYEDVTQVTPQERLRELREVRTVPEKNREDTINGTDKPKRKRSTNTK